MQNQNSIKIEQIFAIIKSEYPKWQTKLRKLFSDGENLFAGNWPDYQSCQTGYHTLGHSLDVALAAARMAGGWNKINPAAKIPGPIFAAGLAAALFHDAGYIKDKNDREGKGGKYTFSHVRRGADMAREYLAANTWPRDMVDLCADIIAITDFQQPPDLERFTADTAAGVMARMVASADLVAQMADVNYLQSLKELYTEFQEAYKFNGKDNIRKNNITVYGSFKELLNGTVNFYQKFVLPRLMDLGHMEQYLVPFFGNGRNPYQENITANLSAHVFSKHLQWRRLGEILTELKLVSREEITEALKRQAAENLNAPPPKSPHHPRRRLMNWFRGTRLNQRCLGDILIEMGAVNAGLLRKGLLSQILPNKYTKNLDREKYLALLQIIVMLQNTRQDSWVLEEIMAMITEITDCHRCALLLAHPQKNKMLIAACSPPGYRDSDPLQEVPLDKGLPGWVFQHGSPAIIPGRRANNGEAGSALSLPENEQKSIMAVPLHIMGEFIGVIELIGKKKGEFDDHDLDFMTILANILASSLDQISLPW